MADGDGARTAEGAMLERARTGDREAFRTIVGTHEGRVFAVALRLTTDEADAMDLTQETFLEAWRALDRFRETSRLSTWLIGIVTRKARELWRRQERRERRERVYAESRFDEAAVRRAMPDARVDLERAISELPPRMRTALVLHCIEGLPQSEVASIMRIAEGTVKAHVHTARQQLKERLEA